MRKFIIVFAAAAIVAAACSRSAVAPHNSLEKFGLNRPVRSISVRDDSLYHRNPEANFDAVFNADGTISELQYIGSEGQKRSFEKYSYDDSCRVVCKDIYDSEGEWNGVFDYSYDGAFLSNITIRNVERADLQTWDYYNDGAVITGALYYDEGVPAMRTDIEWVSPLKKIETASDMEGNYIGTSTLEYFAPEKPSCIISAGDTLLVRYSPQTGLPVWSRSVQVDCKGELFWDGTTEESVPHIYEYTFDRKGNWTVRTEKNGDDPSEVISVIYREISYY